MVTAHNNNTYLFIVFVYHFNAHVIEVINYILNLKVVFNKDTDLLCHTLSKLSEMSFYEVCKGRGM